MADIRTFEFINSSKPLEYLEPTNRKVVRRNATLHRTRNQRAPQTPKKGSSKTSEQGHPRMGMRLRLFPVETQKYMYHLLEYTENVISPSLFPFKTMHRHHPIRQITMCLALQDPRVLNSQLAVASLHSASISSNPRSNIVTALKHQQQAIKLVRDWLATTAGSHVDAGAALCITQLASLELMHHNFEGWQVHMNALRKMAEHPNAKSQLDIIQFATIDTELVGCYFFDKQPSFVHHQELDRPHHDRFPLPPAGLDPIHKATLLSLSSSNHDIFTLDETILDCILELQNLTRMISPAHPIPSPDLYVRHYLSTRTAIEYRLLYLSAEKDFTGFSRTMCLAAQIYVNRVLRTFSRGALFLERHTERLKHSIEVTLSDAGLHTRLPASMLWVAVMGAMAARDGPLRAWFVELVHSACCDMGLGEWQDVQSLLSSFLWPELYLDNDAFILWKEVEEIGASSQLPLVPYRFGLLFEDLEIS